ncbi:tripartite tricarboxylate transporter TctB family protein [Paenibacillus antri]|uniref:Tripartite tricarboxylate transporter TctB family protein n=1 Tax=Paenibacillus antri TaxID=2582848 RepID=A0A5R9G1U3_9BACL|nr:tripartite tricarboxylate transporter TctB family protein [Paenibacillus antri]TLS50312.1 tripartite tricarboxylate transporter TctB family protein [Paenibacillus antri]
MSKTFSRIVSIALFVLGAAFLMESGRISESAYGSNVGPNLFPMGLGILLMLLCVRLFYETFRYPKEEGEPSVKLDYKRFLMILGAALLYAMLLQPLGYLITTFAFLTFSFQVMEKGKLWKSLAIAAAFAFGVYFLFVGVLEGSLPGLPVWFR